MHFDQPDYHEGTAALDEDMATVQGILQSPAPSGARPVDLALPTPPDSSRDSSDSPPRLSLLNATLSALVHSLRAVVDLRFPRRQTTQGHVDSPLFTCLPPELRSLIWYFVLSPRTITHKTSPAHFHVYPSSVWDACTYDAALKRQTTSHLTQISLLITCRAIYHEALRYLYDEQSFTIVLCAGLARPVHKLGSRKSLGRISDCKALFARMRMVELVIQPGDLPRMRLFKSHIASFLAAIDHGQHLREFTLHFNFGIRSRWTTKTDIVRAFLPLGEHFRAHDASPPTFILKLKTETRRNNIRAFNKFCAALQHLTDALSLPSHKPCKRIIYNLDFPTGNPDADFAGCELDANHRDMGPWCLRRGAWGSYDVYVAYRHRPMSKTQRAMICVLFAPVVVPLIIFRRALKGQL